MPSRRWRTRRVAGPFRAGRGITSADAAGAASAMIEADDREAWLTGVAEAMPAADSVHRPNLDR